MKKLPSPAAAVCALLAMALVAFGAGWSFTRGGQDFDVFYQAWRLVGHGHGAEIYARSPDRFLYAPGFAWCGAPFALLPRPAALALWNLIKVSALAAVGFALRRRLPTGPGRDLAVPAGILCAARPLLIDFQYGQVNVLVLASALAALLTLAAPSSGDVERPVLRARITWCWIALGAVAVFKLLALPLLAAPWLARGPLPSARIRARRGALLGAGFAFLVPLAFTGPAGFAALLGQWRDALVARGFPLESHNQSFAAFLHHYFAHEPTHVPFAGAQPIALSVIDLGPAWLSGLAWAWTAAAALLIVGEIRRGMRRGGVEWAAVLAGAMILPSHLVWKPYFVASFPLFALLIARAGQPCPRLPYGLTAGIGLLAVGVNFTGFDFVGGYWAARLEAGSVLLFAHLALLVAVMLPVGPAMNRPVG